MEIESLKKKKKIEKKKNGWKIKSTKTIEMFK